MNGVAFDVPHEGRAPIEGARVLQSSSAEVIMFKKLLVFLGLRHAPTPVRTYLVASSAVGAVPAVLFLAWKYRGRIAPMLRRATPQRSEQLQAAM